MKRHGNLFETCFSMDNLYLAYIDARSGKRYRRATIQFETRLGAWLYHLHRQIHTGEYKPRTYKRFMVYEPKPREICAPWFGDIVVQHAIYRVIRPILERKLIDHNYACRPGKGTHAASDYAQNALRKSPDGSYALKLDIRKFFYRINRQILRDILAKHIKDKRLLDVMIKFTELPEETGIPIGNLLSQLFASMYLNPLDHFIKRTLRVKLYCRYVDDFILFGLPRDVLLSHKESIVQFIADNLGLELSKWTLAPISRGVNFVGYRTWRSTRFIRRHSLLTFRRAARKGKTQSLISILGHAKRTASRRHLVGWLAEKHPNLLKTIPPVVTGLIHRKSHR